jgi:hypothetical protein
MIDRGLWRRSDVGQTTGKAQRGRAGERAARLERARQRRLELDKDREARDARVDAAVADVYQAHDERQEAARAVEAAEQRMGEAINRVLAEGVPLAQAAELTELSVTQVQRLRAAAVGEPRPGPDEAPAGRPGGGEGEAVRSVALQEARRPPAS